MLCGDGLPQRRLFKFCGNIATCFPGLFKPAGALLPSILSVGRSSHQSCKWADYTGLNQAQTRKAI